MSRHPNRFTAAPPRHRRATIDSEVYAKLEAILGATYQQVSDQETSWDLVGWVEAVRRLVNAILAYVIPRLTEQDLQVILFMALGPSAQQIQPIIGMPQFTPIVPPKPKRTSEIIRKHSIRL